MTSMIYYLLWTAWFRVSEVSYFLILVGSENFHFSERLKFTESRLSVSVLVRGSVILLLYTYLKFMMVIVLHCLIVEIALIEQLLFLMLGMGLLSLMVKCQLVLLLLNQLGFFQCNFL